MILLVSNNEDLYSENTTVDICLEVGIISFVLGAVQGGGRLEIILGELRV